MKTFHCDQCGQQVFFENTHCEQCGAILAFVPELRRVVALQADGNDQWILPDSISLALPDERHGELPRRYRLCQNYSQEGVCNWAVPADDHQSFCIACRYNRTIPALIDAQRRIYWHRMESAKRRMLYTLLELNLRPFNRLQDPAQGLAFDFLEPLPGQPVLTGHAEGVITINISEADPSDRERQRELMREGYRTLLGHFRHEIGHYFFDRLVTFAGHTAAFRELFGDERADYGEALKMHYDRGPGDEWRECYISSYASSHPWEDWAETWAHYLHMTDAIGTARACGMRLQPDHPDEPSMLVAHPPAYYQNKADFRQVIIDWFSLTYVLNSLNRSMGTPDSYPFTLSSVVTDKLAFVHKVVMEQKYLMRREI